MDIFVDFKYTGHQTSVERGLGARVVKIFMESGTMYTLTISLHPSSFCAIWSPLALMGVVQLERTDWAFQIN